MNTQARWLQLAKAFMGRKRVKIRMLTSVAGGGLWADAGDSVICDPLVAARYVDSGQAEHVRELGGPETAMADAAPERAVLAPRRKRATA